MFQNYHILFFVSTSNLSIHSFQKGMVECMDVLLSKGKADVNYKEKEHGNSPLLVAALHGPHHEYVDHRYLISLIYIIY